MSIMSEEEKKVYNFLKFYSDDTENEYFDENYCFDKKYAKTIIKIIEKQQKEIYRLQNIKRKDIEDLINNEKENIYINYISKDKIKELKEKVEKEMINNPYDFSYMINELLKEE